MTILFEKFRAMFAKVSKTLPLARIIEVSCYIAGGGAFGVFLRWIQDQLAFDDAGLPRVHALHYMLPIYLLVAAFVLGRFVRRYGKEGLSVSDELFTAFANDGALYAIARWVIGLLMLAGGLITLMSTERDKYADMLRILAILAMLSGLAYALSLELISRRAGSKNLHCVLMLIPMLLYAFWLIYCYRRNSINGVIWAYVVEVATVCAVLFAFFRAAGFVFDAPNWKRCLFDVSFAAVLCLTSLADERYLGMQLILFATALMFLLYNWILVCGLTRTAEPPVVEKKPSDGGFERL